MLAQRRCACRQLLCPSLIHIVADPVVDKALSARCTVTDDEGRGSGCSAAAPSIAGCSAKAIYGFVRHAVLQQTPPSRPNTASLNACLYVRLSTEVFTDLNEIWLVDRGQMSGASVCCIPDFRSRSGRSKSCESWPISRSIFSAAKYVIRRLMVNYDTPRRYRNFLLDIFFILVLIRRHITGCAVAQALC